ncbi:MAG TPA: glycosyltransferase [Myxococcales bacterium]|jgi:glycosyltransferase involved in cell wall biosynthesis
MNEVGSSRSANPSNPSAQPLKGRDIVCFSNDWDGDPLSKTHLMRLLAQDNRILWVNSLGNRAPGATAHDARRLLRKAWKALAGVREVEPNLFVLSPLAVPVFGSEAVGAVNRVALGLQVRRAMKGLGFQRPVVWAFLPAAQWVARSLEPDLLVYHCVDEFSAFSDAPGEAIARMEKQLVREADLVIASAQRLYDSKRALNPRTVLVRHGVDYRHFARALDRATPVPEDVAGLPRPVLGFFGLVADWVDVDLLEALAKANPGGSVVLVGRVRTDVSRLRRATNVHLLGPKPYATLPGYAKAFDVGLLPFRVNELTLNSNPLKVREYLAAGLPVVSTAIPEVEQLGQCLVAHDTPQFLAQVRRALRVPGPRRARSDRIRSESWEARLEEIRGHVAALESSRRRLAR